MFGLLNWRLWVVLGFLALLPILYMKGRIDGTRLADAKHAANQVAANIELRAIEKRRQDRADEAGRMARTREAGIRSAAAGNRGELDGLLDAFAARNLAEESRDAAAQRADAAEKLLVTSGRLLTDIAERCDRHVSDLQTLTEAWPK